METDTKVPPTREKSETLAGMPWLVPTYFVTVWHGSITKNYSYINEQACSHINKFL